MATESACESLRIVEVIGPIEQGLTKPLKCRAEDGMLYYVKGQQTNRSSLWSEWICAYVGRHLGLPIPEFSLVHLDENLLEELPVEWRSVGSLPAFGSRHRSDCIWLEQAMSVKVPHTVQRDLLVFDWWIRNADRSRGNSNLLWNLQSESVVVIDHNLAFDGQFDGGDFVNEHLFGSHWSTVVDDLVTRAEYQRWFASALHVARLAIERAPSEWLWENSEFDIPTRFDAEAALAILTRCEGPELWNTV
jgi:hypothetical protein